MVLLIDNYDSFTYNIFQYIGEINNNIIVKRNDKISIEEIEKIDPSHIIISPGPGRPENAGIIISVIEYFSGKIPILGVCLGHQAIGLCFGAKIVHAKSIEHGKISKVFHNKKGIFYNIPEKFLVVRYHSLCISTEKIPECIEVHAITEDNTIMGIKHKKFKIYGIQFHPESILTQYGKLLLSNFLLC